jgi:hypothetical protein
MVEVVLVWDFLITIPFMTTASDTITDGTILISEVHITGVMILFITITGIDR